MPIQILTERALNGRDGRRSGAANHLRGLTYAGVYVEKGMGLIIPGLTPDTLGEICEYYPPITELRVAAGHFAHGFFIFTLMLIVAVPISLNKLMEMDSSSELAAAGAVCVEERV